MRAVDTMFYRRMLSAGKDGGGGGKHPTCMLS